MSKKTLIMLLVLYIASSLISFGVFKFFSQRKAQDLGSPTQNAAGEDQETALSSLINVGSSEPKDQACPLNGKLYTASEKNAWAKRRPLAVMIENTPDSRPQSGLTSADVVFEAVAEGGVTRFMALLYCGVQVYDTTLAPIRSARTYFLDYASGFNLPIYVHVGGANLEGPANALGQIRDYGWHLQNDIDAMSVGYPTFVRDYNRIEGKEIATEHTMVSSTEKLWAVATKRNWTNMSPDYKLGKKVVTGTDWAAGYKGWSFEDAKSGAGTVKTITYDFWSGYSDYHVEWSYDAASNTYLRQIAGEKQTDLNNGQQVSASNVIVLLTTEKGPIDEKKHMLYGTTGTGDALLFKNGEVSKITWTKKERESELEFVDKGKSVTLNRGQVWISILGKGTEVSY